MTANDCGTSIPMDFSSVNLQEMIRLEMLLALVTLMELLLEVNIVVRCLGLMASVNSVFLKVKRTD